MANIQQIKDRIAEVAGRRKNVELEEIEWVVTHLGLNGHEVSSRGNDHAILFRVGREKFGVCRHHRGSRQIKACYVDEFLDAMERLGLYDG